MTTEVVNVLTTSGLKQLTLDEADRSLAAQHVNAVTHYRDTGQTEQLEAFRGKQIGGVQLETDPRELQRLARLGRLDFQEFYES
jgi:hypothetical protein